MRHKVGALLDEVPRQAKIKRSAYQEQGAFPIVDQSQDFIAGYTDDEQWLYRGKLPVVVFGDHTRVLKFINFSFCVGADGTQLLRPIRGVDIRFLYYALRNVDLTNYGYERHFKYLKEEEIEVPSPVVQRRIAHTLASYDDLIENCQRRIRILEEMARALYREWFVHFRFPRHEKVLRVDSSLGPIPKGWEVKRLNEIAENFDRLRRPLSKMQRAQMPGEYSYYGAAKVFDHINDYIFDGEYLLMAEDGSVITNDRAPVLQLVNEKFWPNNHTHILRGKAPISTHFLYLGLSLVDVSPYITGAAQPKITQENMNRISFVCGPAELHRDFDRLIAPMIHQTQVLQRQIQNLRRTRDLLLPRLLSGQIALKASEVEEVAA